MKGDLERQARELVGKEWGKAARTREKLRANVREFARFCETRYGLTRINGIKTHMVQAYVQALRERGVAPSTMADKVTAIRVLAAAVGKANIVPFANAALGISRRQARKSTGPADAARLAEIRATLHSRAEGGNPVALMMRAADVLRREFGLRVKESLLPACAEERGSRSYLVVEAPGRRPLVLEVVTEGQVAAVSVAAETAARLGNEGLRIIPPGMALKRAYDAQRNEWRALGGTREHGATMGADRG
ncbi:site-specific integrase [Geobacter pickeringii]|uniref:Core-binding (CB) domain-containing protein n=1 Tax=Geobacter pickeringii TaxID=345632 RepID=A0A0B5BA53_9BACT|nr:site-specific integrase [Geobacter pickeringii]AJE03598.1 hypothetical protein GPICK_09755 [Geobacter pickeringii]